MTDARTPTPDPAALREADRTADLAERAAAAWHAAQGTPDAAEAVTRWDAASDRAAEARRVALGALLRAVDLAAEDVTAAAAASVWEEPRAAADDAAWLADVATLVRVACEASAEDVAALARLARTVAAPLCPSCDAPRGDRHPCDVG